MDSAESAPTRYNQEQSQEQSQSDQHQEAQNSDQCIDSSKLLEEKRWLVLANLSLKFQLEQAKQKEIAALHALSRMLFSYSKQAHTEDKDAYDAQGSNSKAVMDAASYNNIIYKMWEHRRNQETLYAAEDGYPAWIKTGKLLNDMWIPSCVSPSCASHKEELLAYYLKGDELRRKYIYEDSPDLALCNWGELSTQEPDPRQESYIMYHGTSHTAAAQIRNDGFRLSKKGMLGNGVYLTPEVQYAMKYARRFDDPKVLRCIVRVGNVYRVERGTPEVIPWQNHGYDTAWSPQGILREGSDVCVKDAWRVVVKEII